MLTTHPLKVTSMRIQQTCSLQNGTRFQSIFSRLSLASHFIMFVRSHEISRLCQMLLRLSARFNGYTLSRPRHWPYTFPPFSLITHFPAACHWSTYTFPPLFPLLHIFPSLSLVSIFLLVTRLPVTVTKYTLQTREKKKHDSNFNRCNYFGGVSYAPKIVATVKVSQ